MADTVLESFLIRLGFQIDQSTSKAFTTTIADAGKAVTGFVESITAMAVAVEEAVRRTAAQLDRLHNTALLAGESTQEMKKYASAIAAVGGSSEAAAEAAQAKLGQLLDDEPWKKHVDTISQVIGHEYRGTSDFFI